MNPKQRRKLNPHTILYIDQKMTQLRHGNKATKTYKTRDINSKMFYFKALKYMQYYAKMLQWLDPEIGL